MDSPVEKGSIDEPATDPPAAIRPLSMLMVVMVEQTEAGRTAKTFDSTTASLKFDLLEERPVDDTLTAAVEKDVEGADGVANQQVLLLESPMKKLDRLITTLADDRAHVESLSFSLLHVEYDAPMLKSIDAVRSSDPTKVRHQGHGIPLIGSGPADPAFEIWQANLVARDFAPITSATAGTVSQLAGPMNFQQLDRPAMGDGSQNQGPDPMASVLFIVR